MSELGERFWSKVQPEPNSGCWLWDGTTSRGYGRHWLIDKQLPAHRLAYEELVGPIPEGLQLDHLCRVRCCVNPDHLEPVTHAENVRRGDAGKFWKKKTHCPHGHEYTEENTYTYKSPQRGITGQRHCRKCRNARAKIANANARARARQALAALNDGADDG